MMLPSRSPNRATPEVTRRYWPRACECQAVRATVARWPASCGAAITSSQTSPANCSGGFFVVGTDASMFMVSPLESRRSVRRQQHLGRTALIHRLVPLGCLVEGQREVEDDAGVDLAIPDELDQLGQVGAHGSGPAVQVHAREEQLEAVERHVVRDADVSDVPARPRGADGLHHRLLRAYRLDHAVGAQPLREL